MAKATTKYRCGTYNLKVARDKDEVVREVLQLLIANRLDLLFTQETKGYWKALRKPLKRAGYRRVASRGFERKDSIVIVRKGVKARRKRLHHMGGVEWERNPYNQRPGLHPPRFVTSVEIDGVMRVASVHLPPGPHEGMRYPLRGRAFRAMMSRLNVILRGWDKALLVGDWNAQPGDPAIEHFLEATGADAHGNGIDYAIAKNVRVRDMQRLNLFGKSDHKPRLFTVEVRHG